VFRTNFFLPSEIPTGEYQVSVYLFRDGNLLAGNTQALNIHKGGFSERIARPPTPSRFSTAWPAWPSPSSRLARRADLQAAVSAAGELDVPIGPTCGFEGQLPYRASRSHRPEERKISG
jgi:hypothetical protein